MSESAPHDVAAFAERGHAPALGRTARLAIKEVRETLRDRRTLVTLLLMPFLLYPLLGMVLRKFLLAGVAGTVIPTYHVAMYTDEDTKLFSALISEAQQVLASRENAGAIPKLRVEARSDAEQALRKGEIDVVLSMTRRPPLELTPGQSWEADCEMLIAEGSLTGERAARHVEDCLRVYGNRVIGFQLRSAKIRQRSTPIRIVHRRIVAPERPGLLSLPALVPFVLILMTITGAVYPAIDLTAGERERGTLELLIAAPVPRLALLFAKYVAVMAVATLTATVNLVAMTGTIAVCGLGHMLWGQQGLLPGTVVATFSLLVLLAGFFSAVLLAITSFARSFKEAQAYLIPVMLCALGPGLISLMPGVELGPWLAMIPLLNIALFSRDILNGTASIAMGVAVVVSTVLYAFAALTLAARLFAADAVLYDARIGWSEIWRRPRPGGPASVSLALFCLACMFPISFASHGAISTLTNWGIAGKLTAMIVANAAVFGGVPLVFGMWRRVSWDSGFQWRMPRAISWFGAALLGLCLWPMAHEITLATQYLGLVSLESKHFEQAQKLIEQCRTVPPWLVLLAIAGTPAVFEEFCFRGFVFSAFRSRMRPWRAILGSGVLFGLFHLIATDALAVERLIPSTLLGVILGWVCFRTSSVFPGMVLHACHNGLLTLMLYYQPEIKAAGWGLAELAHLPMTWLAVSVAGSAAGACLVHFCSRRS